MCWPHALRSPVTTIAGGSSSVYVIESIYVVHSSMLRRKMPREKREQSIELPPVLATGWGLTPPPTRGPRPGMTAAAIVTAAIELADVEGIGAVSMARVAERL